jgi:hypothetical protein
MKLFELSGGDFGWISQAITAKKHEDIIGRGAGKYKLIGRGTPGFRRKSGTLGGKQYLWVPG